MGHRNVHCSARQFAGTSRPARALLPVLLLGLLSSVATQPASAAFGDLRPYLEGYIAGSAVEVAGEDFFPGYAGLTAGVFVFPGLALEVHADGELADDSRDGFDLAYENGFGVAARFQSRPIGGVSGYVVLGYTAFRVNQQPSGPSLIGGDVTETFDGTRVSIGVINRLSRFPLFSISAEYRRYFTEGGLDIDSLVLGLRISPPP